jgi:hypothetical protein
MESTTDGSGRTRGLRLSAGGVLLTVALAQVPVVSAHGGTELGGLSSWHGVLVALGGFGVLGGSALLKQAGYLSPTRALYGVLLGLAVVVVGVVLFDGLSPDPSYSASTMPFPRSLYPLLSLATGLLTVVGSFAVGWLRWRSRPRYMFLGVVMGLWISYPYLIPGVASATHPLGYGLVLGTPVLVGYIVWTDAWPALSIALDDAVVRRFALGTGALLALFFMSVSGCVSFFWEAGVPHEPILTVLPSLYQLVTWATLEIGLPHIPLFVAVSVGIVAIIGLLSVLVGLNAALIAHHWRAEEGAGTTQGTVGSAAIAGSCTCGCCGPLVAKVAILATGPSAAAPLYWVFVDSASPFSTLFIAGSILLFTGTLVYSVEPA